MFRSATRLGRLSLRSTPRFFSTATTGATQGVTGKTLPVNTFKEPTEEALLKHANYIQRCLPAHIQQISLYKDELSLCVAPSALLPLLQFLRDNTACQYKLMMDVAGVDYPTKPHRFEVVYHLLSVRYNTRIRVKTYCEELGSVPSATGLFPAANWFEREAWDMYGIFFTGHPDLRRILTDYGFNGHPLRKDFPLTGYVQVRYDEEKKRVVQEPLDMAQQFRYFDYQSPWEQVGPGQATPAALSKEAEAAKTAQQAEKK